MTGTRIVDEVKYDLFRRILEGMLRTGGERPSPPMFDAVVGDALVMAATAYAGLRNLGVVQPIPEPLPLPLPEPVPLPPGSGKAV